MNRIISIVLLIGIFLKPTYKKSFYENGRLKSEGWMEDNRKNKYWFHYYPNGNIKSKGHYDDDLKVKYWYHFDQFGNTLEESHYKNDLRDGWWKVFKQDTILEIKYKRSIKTGLSIYSVNDKPVKAEYYKNGIKINEWFNLQDFKKEYPLLMNNPKIRVIIPAFNEEASIGLVIKDIPETLEEIIVVSNNSTDRTELVAKKAGATVLRENRKGYGYACLKAMNYIKTNQLETDIIVFLDGDYSDYPEEMPKVLEPILKDNFDFVIGARVKHLREKGSMTFPQIFGNWLATFLMKLMYAAKYSDLGPFRAIKYDKLLALNMEDKTYGWTVEMQLKALKHNLKYTEVEVNYRNRIGTSKVSGTIKGAVMAGVKIIGWIFKYAIK